MFTKQILDFKEAKKKIEQGEVVYTEGNEDRAIGKTTAIIAYSIWTGKPIVTASQSLVKLYKSYNPQVEVYLIKDVIGLLPRTALLVDESVTLKQYNILKDMYEISGFMSINGGVE